MSAGPLALRNPIPSLLRRLAIRAGRRSLVVQQLYEVLCVRPGAGEAEIKAAFRSLAKQLHPDLKPGDVDADQRLRAVIRAYQTLSDPPSRAAYDTQLARQRSLRRWRLHEVTLPSHARRVPLRWTNRMAEDRRQEPPRGNAEGHPMGGVAGWAGARTRIGKPVHRERSRRTWPGRRHQ
jgi:curved DNA-binding protein CbpA